MDFAGLLVVALLLDAAFGEPKSLWDRFPHPAVLIGKAIGWADQTYNHGTSRQMKGAVLAVALIIGGWSIGHLIAWIGWLPTVILVAILLAQKSLVEHVKAVEEALRVSLGDGRKSVAMIVSRDTRDMDESAVSRSAIESAAENLSDGVIAPAFWFLIGGLPGLLIYKAVNTADSMIGYKTERHKDFGWAAAKLDDLLNWVPARLTAAMIALTQNVLRTWADIKFDAGFHKSPNAGWPEAAMARALNIALAGPRAYDGEMQEFPFVNERGRRNLNANDIQSATRVLWQTWGLMVGVTLLIAIF